MRTIIAPEPIADDVITDANSTVANTLSEGVPLIAKGDPDDADVKARAWDLPIPDQHMEAFQRGVSDHDLDVYERPDDVERMSDAISDAGYRRQPMEGP